MSDLSPLECFPKRGPSLSLCWHSQKGTNLESIAKMKNAAIAARSGLPENAGKIPQADRSKFIQDFQSSISGLVAAIEKMEKAVQEDRFQDAQKELDSINELKREGHSAFAEKKER